MNNKLRILCLHGYRQSDVSFSQKTGGLRKSLKALATFEFIKAPHAVIGEEDSYSWFYSNPKTHNVESYKCLDRSTTDPGFQESLKFLRDHVECQGPYDGIMAFSQGACMAGILTSVLDSNQLKFLILFSGFKSRITKHDVYYEKKIDGVRSLHVYGATDEVIDPGMSEDLADCFEEHINHKHPGGHFVPTNINVRTVVKDFLVNELKIKYDL